MTVPVDLVRLAEESAGTACRNLRSALARVKGAVYQIESRTQGTASASSDHVEELAKAVSEVARWNAVLVERRAWQRTIHEWPHGHVLAKEIPNDGTRNPG